MIIVLYRNWCIVKENNDRPTCWLLSWSQLLVLVRHTSFGVHTLLAQIYSELEHNTRFPLYILWVFQDCWVWPEFVLGKCKFTLIIFIEWFSFCVSLLHLFKTYLKSLCFVFISKHSAHKHFHSTQTLWLGVSHLLIFKCQRSKKKYIRPNKTTS